MLCRKSKGSSGIVKYLVDGVKNGRDYTRDELDYRVPVCGDLELLERTIEHTQRTRQWNSNFQHYTFGFTHSDMAKLNEQPEKAKQLCDMYMQYYYGHQIDDVSKLVHSAELHLPKLKFLKNRTTGAMEERFPHMHLIVSDLDVTTGLKLAPAVHNNRAMKAFQSWVCKELDLDDPQNFLRADRSITKADIISRFKKTIQDGPELQRELLSELVIEQYYRTKDSDNFRQDFKAALEELGVSKFKADGDGVTLSFDNKLLGVDNKIEPIKIKSHWINGQPSHLTVEGYKPQKISAIKASRVSACMSDTKHGGLSQRQALQLFNSARKKPKQTLKTHFRNEFSEALAGVKSLSEVREILGKLPCKYTEKPGQAIKVEIDTKALGINEPKPVKFNLYGKDFAHLHKMYWPEDKSKHIKPKSDKEIWMKDLQYRTEKHRKEHENRVYRKPRDLEELQALREDWFKSRTKTSKVLYYAYKTNFHLSDIDNYHTYIKDNARHIVKNEKFGYKNDDKRVQIIDKGDKIVVATDTDFAMREGIHLALKVARSKGWELEALNIAGNDTFKDAVRAEMIKVKKLEAEGKLFDAPPSQVPTDKPAKTKKTKTTKAPTRKKNQKRDSVTSSVRDQVDAQRKLKKPTNEIEYYKKNIKAESVLEHCNLSDKIKMDISKYEIARNRIRPAGTSQKGLNVIDFLVREGSMSFQAAKSTLELLSQDDSNLRNKNMPKPEGKEAQQLAKKSSAPQPQQKEETKQQPTAQAEKSSQPAPAVPVTVTERPTQPVKQAAPLSDMDKRIQRLRDIPKPIFDSKIAQLGGNSKSSTRKLHARFQTGDSSITERDIAQLENLVKGVDVNKVYPGTWSQYEREIFKAGKVVPGIKNDDGHELSGEEQKIIFGRLKSNYENNNSSLKQPK